MRIKKSQMRHEDIKPKFYGFCLSPNFFSKFKFPFMKLKEVPSRSLKITIIRSQSGRKFN